MSDLVAHQVAHCICDLLSTAIGDRDSEHQGVTVRRGPLSLPKHSHGRGWQEIEATNGFDPNTATVDRGVSGQCPDLRLDRREDIRDLSPRSFQVIDRAHPERHGRDSEIEAPSKHLVQLLSAEIVGYSGVSEVVLAGIASVAIKDDPDMAWDRM